MIYCVRSGFGAALCHMACCSRLQIGTQKIGNLFIPGTHNSGAFSGVPKFLENYILNQDRSIWTQLVHGIRYLDLRIGYYEHEGCETLPVLTRFQAEFV
jgi:hypothetical protein